MKFLTFRIVGWIGESKSFAKHAKDGHELPHPSQEQQEQKS
jgi:hypothetical protein